MGMLKDMIRRIRFKLGLGPTTTQIITLDTNKLYISAAVPEEPEVEEEDLREMKEPIKVIHELEVDLKPISTEDIKQKIKELKERKKFMLTELNIQPIDEDRAINMLNARLKYPKFAHLFTWKTTTQNKIDQLTSRYALKWDDIDLYVKKIPDEVITQMEKYNRLFKKVSGRKVKFSIIGPADHFKTKDPILLVESPFGSYYYILCAWDKEVSIVSELLDGEELVI